MKLGIFVNQHLFFDGKQYTCNYHTLLPFMFSLLEYFDHIDILAPVQLTTNRKGRNILDMPQGIKIINLPYYEGALGVTRVLHKLIPATIFKSLQSKKQWDVAGCIMPTAAGLAFDIASMGIPKFFLVRGNKTKTLKVLNSTRHTNRWILFAGNLIEKYMKRRINSGVHAFVLGQELYDIFKNQNNSVHIWKGLLPDNLLTQYHDPKPVTEENLFNILFIGRLTPEKGIYDLVDIVHLVHGKEKQIFVHVVGEGPLKENLEHKVNDLNLDHVIKFLGALAHPDPLFKEFDWADAFLLPSYTEGIPRVIAEAMSRGVPVVASAVGGIPQIIENEVDGFLVPAGDVDGFAEKLLMLKNNGSMRDKMAQKGYEKAIRLFSDKAQREEMARILGVA